MTRLTLKRRTTQAPRFGSLQEITRGTAFSQAVVLNPKSARITFWAIRALPALCDVLEDDNFPFMSKDIRFVRVEVVQHDKERITADESAWLSLTLLALHVGKTSFVEVRFVATTHNVARVRFHFEALTQVPEDVLIRRFSHGRTHS